MASARRDESEMEASIRNTARDKAKYILKSEHESILKVREDELVADTLKQLAIGYVDMKQRTTEAVELSRAEHHKEIIMLRNIGNTSLVLLPIRCMKSRDFVPST